MIDQLKKFKAVIDEQSFTKAANKLNISQPAISIAIDELEKQFGGELLIRSKSGITTTELGDLIYDYANEFTILNKNLMNEVLGFMKNSNSEIKFGAIVNFGMKIVEKIIPKFQVQDKSTKVNIDIDNSTRLIEKIEKQELDFAFVTKPVDRIPKSIRYESFTTENFVTFALKDFEASDPISFIGFNQNSYTFKNIDSKLKTHFKSVNYTAHSSSPELILKMALQGRGATSLPENLISGEIRKKIKIINDIKIEREIGLIRNRNLKLSRVETEFIEQIKRRITN
jgi:DNA-binding transcriptional LysR family regulator